MRTSNRAPIGEVWMVLTDAGRKRLATIMVVQDLSQRQLARGAGWGSHSYLGRLLRGEVTTLDTDAAARIAAYLGIGMDDLFVARTSTAVARNGERKHAA